MKSHYAVLMIDPKFDSIRDDPRFNEILKKMGLSSKSNMKSTSKS